MNVSEFAKEVAKLEEGKKQVDIAQIREVLKVINKLLGGNLYKLVRKMEKGA